MGSPPVRTTFQPSLSLKCSDFRFSVTTLLPVIVLSIIGWYCYLTSDHTFYDWHLIVFKQTQTQEPARSQTDGGQRSYMGRDTAGNRLSLSSCWHLRMTTISFLFILLPLNQTLMSWEERKWPLLHNQQFIWAIINPIHSAIHVVTFCRNINTC